MNKITSKIGVVTQRDRKLFEYLFENKVSTCAAIQQDIFNNVSIQKIYRRMGKLERSNFIKKDCFSLNEQRVHIYNITDNAYKKYVVSDMADVRRKQLNSDSIEHDLTLLDIRRRILRCTGIVNYYSENSLQSSHRYYNSHIFRGYVLLRSDAVIELLDENKNTGYIPLEYEASQKESTRYEKKINDYYMGSDTAVVLWICRNTKIQNSLIEARKALNTNEESKMYFSLLENVINNKDKIIFKNMEGKIVELK